MCNGLKVFKAFYDRLLSIKTDQNCVTQGDFDHSKSKRALDGERVWCCDLPMYTLMIDILILAKIKRPMFSSKTKI